MVEDKKIKTVDDYLSELGPTGFNDPGLILLAMRGQHPDIAKFRIKEAYALYFKNLKPSNQEIEFIKNDIRSGYDFTKMLIEDGHCSMTLFELEQKITEEAVQIWQARRHRHPFIPLWPW